MAVKVAIISIQMKRATAVLLKMKYGFNVLKIIEIQSAII